MPLAIVTGASRGIGMEVALRLVAAGYDVACIARTASDLEQLAAKHPRLIPLPVDVTDAHALESAVGALLRERGPCAILVNNAGYGLRAAVEEIPLDAWRRQFEVNLFSAAKLVQIVLPSMREARSGCIVNVSSVAGRIATPFSGAYCATKYALEAMSDALRMEVRPFGINVVLIEPGPVKTDFLRAAAAVSDAVIERRDSPYAQSYQVMRTQLQSLHTSAWSADVVADRIVAAATAARPPQRVAAYGLLLRATVAIHALWPTLFDALVGRRMVGERSTP